MNQNQKTSQKTTASQSVAAAADKVQKMSVTDMLTVAVRAFVVATAAMNAQCLSAMREGRINLRSFTVVRKVAGAVAKNRPDVTVRASDADGNRIKIIGSLGDDTVELTGIGLPRELLTDVFAVPAGHIAAFYDIAESALESMF